MDSRAADRQIATPARDLSTTLPFRSHYEERHCQSCGHASKHRVTTCYAPDGAYSGSFARCWECPPEQLTALIVQNGQLRHIIVADDRNITMARRLLAHGSQGHESVDHALTASGFERVTEWVTDGGTDTCKVQWT